MKQQPAHPIPSLSGDDLRLAAILWSIPLIPGLFFLIEWLVAWATLGHMPEPIVDSPMKISTFSSILHRLTALSLFAVFPAIAIGSGLCLLRWGMGPRTLAVAGIALMMGIGLFAAIVQVSFEAFEWWYPRSHYLGP